MSACLQSDSQQLLRRLRLQLAEQISALAADRSGSAAVTALHKGTAPPLQSSKLRLRLLQSACASPSENKMGSLIHKADRVLTWLSQSAAAAGSSAPLSESSCSFSGDSLEARVHLSGKYQHMRVTCERIP